MPAKVGTSGLLEGVDPGILGLLGISDNKDIDLGTYKTLLREKMMAGRMTDTKMSSGDTESLTEEWKRVKSIKEEQPKTTGKKVADNLVGRKDSPFKATTTKAPSGTKIDPKKLLPPAGDDSSEEVSGLRKSVEDLKGVLTPGLSKIESNLQGMLEALKKGNQVDKKSQEKSRITSEKSSKAGREAGLETKADVQPQNKMLDTVKKPVKGFFATILDFINKVLFGAVVVGLLKLLSDPMGFLKPIFKIINAVIDALNWLVQLVVDSFRKPFNLLIGALNTGIGFVVGAVNKALSIIPGIEDPIPDLKLPEIPKFPDIPKIPLQDESAPPVQSAAEGGMVWRESTSKSGDGTTAADQLGTHSIRQVTPDEAHQRYAQHGLPSMELEDGKVVPDVGKMSADKITTSLQMIREDVDKGSHSQKKEMIDQLDWLINNPHGQPEAIQNTINRLVPGSEAQVAGDLGDDIGAAAKMKGGGEVPAQKMSVKKGGKITSGSGVKVKGAGKDTQLVAAQPGEIVMSKKAVDKIGADKLLAMNKEGGGDNKPRFINSGEIQRAEGGGNIMGMSGGGSVTQTIMSMQGGGSVGSISSSKSISTPPPAKNRVSVMDLSTMKKRKRSSRGGTTGGSSGDQKVVQPFSPSDVNNSASFVIKGMYNIVGG